jgi:hypothetical protein
MLKILLIFYLINMILCNNNSQIKGMEPSINLLEKQIQVNKSMTNITNKHERHEIEPRAEDLDQLIKINKKKVTSQNETNIKKNAENYGEYMHDQVIGFHGANLSNNKNLMNLNDSKPADLDDYSKWIELEKNLSKLNRFKRLHQEISNLEKNIDYKEDRLVVDNRKQNKKKLSAKLEMTIQQIEHGERKLKRFDL